MRVATYHRVSTLDQDPTLARDDLLLAANVRAASASGAVTLQVEETGSGAKNDRPGLARIMDAARRGQIDCVLVWKIDRFGRSCGDLLANVQELESCGVRFVAVTQGIDSGNGAVGKLMLTILGGVAEFERELIRERTRLGMAKARKAGKAIGRPRALLSDALIARAVALRESQAPGLSPLSWRAVCAQLEDEGLQNVPDQAVLAAACLKRYPGLPRGRRGWGAGY